MKQVIVAALAALCVVSAHAKGFGGHMPKMGFPHPERAAKTKHEGHKLKAAKSAKGGGAERALKSIDDIADSIIPDGDAPMVSAKYAAH
jgi:hypothetical protein